MSADLPTGKLLANPALCPSCRHNEPYSYKLAERWTTGYRCRRYIVCFPTCTYCTSFEREPGAD